MENVDYIKLAESKVIEEFKELRLLHKFALSEIETKVNILNEEHKVLYEYNPIEHVKTRLKTPVSIVKKLKRKNSEVSTENAKNHIKDIAGIRIICSFKNDIYIVAKMLESQDDIKVIEVKDYVTNPKENGYQSYHMIVKVPVFLSEKTVDTVVEVQIRTSAMDFWASVEHKINYKSEHNMTNQLKQRLKECSLLSDRLDEEMYEINKQINLLNEE